jgi:chorismate-pyruvate lyase
MSECIIGCEEIRKLNRDLRLLIATNGTLTRILGIVADEEIVVHIVEQEIHRVAPEEAERGQLPGDRVLQRRVVLQGRSSGHRFVAAESLIAIDVLPPAITASLTETRCPIGEVMAAERLETFKEAADVWIGQSPNWMVQGQPSPPPDIVSRRYRIIVEGRPVIIIAEYFLESLSRVRHRDERHSSLTSRRNGLRR